MHARTPSALAPRLALALAASVLVAATCTSFSLIADPAYVPSIPSPEFAPGTGPVVIFDGGHVNRGGTAAGQYWRPLLDLIEADGYVVRETQHPYVPEPFTNCNPVENCPFLTEWVGASLMVIARPAADFAPDELAFMQFLGINAFFIVEMNDADRVPQLLASLGGLTYTLSDVQVDCPGGEPGCRTTEVVFDEAKQPLNTDHILVTGRGPAEAVDFAYMYGGGGIDYPRGVFPPLAYEPVLGFGPDATSFVVEGTEPVEVPAEGFAAGLAMLQGGQRMYITTDAAMNTALARKNNETGQIVETFGFQEPEAAFDEQLVLNVLHWLDRFPVPTPLPGCFGQCPDISFVPNVPDPLYPAGDGPRVLIDSAHNNFHTIGNRYLNFAAVLEADGLRPEDSPLAFDDPAFVADLQNDVGVVVIANARETAGNEPNALSASEVGAILDWVRAGGALFLIADHIPFSGAYGNLAAALGIAFAVEDGDGVYTVPDQCAPWLGSCDPTLNYSVRASNPAVWEGQLDGSHSVAKGRSPSEAVEWVEIFRGSAAEITAPPPDATITPVGTVPPNAFVSSGGQPVSVAGFHTALAIELGAGRVFVATEAGGLTAQVYAGQQFGFTVPEGRYNEQYVLNVAHWLVGALP